MTCVNIGWLSCTVNLFFFENIVPSKPKSILPFHSIPSYNQTSHPSIHRC
eukprot:NODE_2730_length_406_cov_5.759104_g2649_i0.p3 GENE.NODE_2730_length_406_cov_5.759104_g2649_i0~~NODE_2730_length_406_cov_5.759104_g2649_i0.p3  ORF type:complete len:50 (-),score=10.14 NODE_2730_length_406_cov_5.759104_g2649_i0:18-167(-)